MQVQCRIVLIIEGEEFLNLKCGCGSDCVGVTCGVVSRAEAEAKLAEVEQRVEVLKTANPRASIADLRRIAPTYDSRLPDLPKFQQLQALGPAQPAAAAAAAAPSRPPQKRRRSAAAAPASSAATARAPRPRPTQRTRWLRRSLRKD